MAIQRITGMASGLDVDTLVKTTMQAYQAKVDVQTQKKEMIEIKQKLYRGIISEGRDMYNKYFDILKSDNLLSTQNYVTTKFESKDETIATATGLTGAVKDNYNVTITQLAKAANRSLSQTDVTSDLKFDNGGNSVTILATELSGKTEAEQAAIINTKVATIGLSASKSDFATGIVVKSNTTGIDSTFGLTIGANPLETVANGQNAIATIENSTGTLSNQEYSSNKVVLDGVQFSLNSIGSTTIVGKTDTKGIKDKIVSFVNDYNAMIEKLNKYVTDKHDRSYSPLNATQKESMSEDEIKLWNEKVEKGQLSRDSDLSRIVNTLKSAMSSSVSGISSVLEKIGINPVKNYTTKNGMFTIDEDKLTQALEKDPDTVMNMFTQKPSDTTGLTEAEITSKTGIIYRMKDIFNNEFVSSTKSALINRAGLEGTISFTQSILSKSVTSYEKKINEMKATFSEKEQALYSKFAKLETAMNKYNSQSTYLGSMMGSQY